MFQVVWNIKHVVRLHRTVFDDAEKTAIIQVSSFLLCISSVNTVYS